MQKKQTNNNNKITSLDAPPLDFSFKNIKQLQQILSIKPHQGKRKPILADIEESNKQDNKSKQQIKVEVKAEDEIVQKTTETKLEIVRGIEVSSLIANQTQNANTNKAKNEPVKVAKKTQQVQLLPSTLYLSYNKLRSIQNFYTIIKDVFLDISHLKWIDLSHNLLITLDYDFKEIKELRTLYLHCNFIKDFGDIAKLKHLENLKNFTIHGNPLQNHPHFRSFIISLLPQISKIDSALVTKREVEVSTHLIKQMNLKKLPVIQNAEVPKQESQGQDS